MYGDKKYRCAPNQIGIGILFVGSVKASKIQIQVPNETINIGNPLQWLIISQRAIDNYVTLIESLSYHLKRYGFFFFFWLKNSKYYQIKL